jgi:sulfopyruvate decarboxylase TPP-binding subunit
MRGEWGEFNSMQVPMGKATARSLELMGVNTYHVERVEELAEVVEAGVDLAFNSDQSVAILISQRLLGKKNWNS